MKLHKPIHLSALRSPTYKHKVACPLIDDIRASYWRDLAIECYTKLANFGWTNEITNKRLRKWAFVGFTWAAFIPSFAPVSTHTVYADPIAAQTLNQIKPLPLLKEPSMVPQNALELVYISLLRPSGTFANTYDPGQCTWYAASRLPVPNNWGNAINWGYAAMAAGYTVSDVPKPGAVAWSVSDSYLGHVAVVEDDGVTISEMNYNGPYSIDSRIPNPGEFRYIYL